MKEAWKANIYVSVCPYKSNLKVFIMWYICREVQTSFDEGNASLFWEDQIYACLKQDNDSEHVFT